MNHAARTLLLMCWLIVIGGLAKLGLPAWWASALFFLGPVAAVAALDEHQRLAKSSLAVVTPRG